MYKKTPLKKIAINARARKLLNILLNENPRLKEIVLNATCEEDVHNGVKSWVSDDLRNRPLAYNFYKEQGDHETLKKLEWRDFAAIRIMDYIDNAGLEFEDLNLRGEMAQTDPFRLIFLAAVHGSGGAKPYFFQDMLQLFRQYRGEMPRRMPTKEKLEKWMSRHPSGCTDYVVDTRISNKIRILNIIIDKIDSGEFKSKKYSFQSDWTREQKLEEAIKWWNDYKFHLRFAIRTPELLNEMLDYALDVETMENLMKAKEAGIPFFVNPYYLSLLNVREPKASLGADYAIRSYILYTRTLVNEFGHIVAWEKEDLVKPGKPNAAGWLLPSQHNIHRRYPEVAILIPDTVGRACGGLCTSCQRMYDFQSGHLNFNLEKLKPTSSWDERLIKLMDYYENDSQIRDILVTGGDALMSSNKSLEKILDAIYEMAKRKIEANKKRPNSKKYAEMVRVRLGTRLPVYMPQRITEELTQILADFKAKASKIGIKQFVIQTHYVSAIEVTPESKLAVHRLNSAGWIVTNQLVFTAAASRRGHTAKLRKVLNDTGVLTYYTFSVKGYMENFTAFATNARAVQEQLEEKQFGIIPKEYSDKVRAFAEDAENLVDNIKKLRKEANIPFLATDRNVLNLPGVGKSLTFRTIGITRYGRRILEFDHDGTRSHSPIINKMGKVIIAESKPIAMYLEQLEDMGENPKEYESIYGYSMGQTESRMPIYEYPDYSFEITDEMTNLDISE